MVQLPPTVQQQPLRLPTEVLQPASLMGMAALTAAVLEEWPGALQPPTVQQQPLSILTTVESLVLAPPTGEAAALAMSSSWLVLSGSQPSTVADAAGSQRVAMEGQPGKHRPQKTAADPLALTGRSNGKRQQVCILARLLPQQKAERLPPIPRTGHKPLCDPQQP